MGVPDTRIVRRGPPRGLGWGLAAVTVGLIVGGALWAGTDEDSPPTTTRPNRSTTTSAAITAPAIDLEPLGGAVSLDATEGAPALVATFRGFLVWGTTAAVEVNVEAAETRQLPAAPIAARNNAGSVWTGAEMIVWGGPGLADGAAYDLTNDRWRTIAPSPLAAGTPLVSVWTGTEMLVWGSQGRTSVDGAAYNASTDSWRELSDAPVALTNGNGVLLGGSNPISIAVVGSWLDNDQGAEITRALLYDIGADRWTLLPDPDLWPQSTWLSWTGQQLVAWDYTLQARALTPGASSWRPLPDIPLEERECYTGGSTSAPVLLTYCDQAATYDPATRSWQPLTLPQFEPGDAKVNTLYGPVETGPDGQVVLTTTGLFILR